MARVPRGPLSAVIADRLIRSAAARIPVRLAYPDGTVVGAADPTLPTMVIHHPDAFARRLGRYGLIGFGESYMAGEWTSDDPVGLFNEFAKAVNELIPPALQRLRPLAVVRPPRSQHNSRAHARRNIAEHYDLSNDLFAEFLDETMTYSCALFDTLPASPADLPGAQRRKIDRLLDTARVGPGSRVLEIGTGWGELCLRAAARGAHVRSITLSAEQHRHARRRVTAAGLSDRVDIDLCDYRDVDGRYDAVLSVEMIEAVGYRFWPTYFQTLDRLVVPAAGSRSRPSPCRTTECWPPAIPTPGSRSTSFPAACCRRPRRSWRSPNGTRGCALWTCTRCGRITPRRCGCGGSGSSNAGMRWRRWVSTRFSTGCGSCTWHTPRRVSSPDISMCTNGPSHPRKWPMNFIVVSAASLAILVVVHGVTFLNGRRIGRYNVVDVAWGIGFVAVAAVAAGVGTGDLFRRVLLLILVAVWGLRLAWHMTVKSAGKGEDPRYRDLLRGDFSAGHVLRKVFAVQAAATWFVSLPLQVSVRVGSDRSAVASRCPSPAWCCGSSVWLSSCRRPPVAPLQARPGQQGRHHGPRPVGVDQASQLLWRRLRVVGPVAGQHRSMGLAAHGALTAGADDLLPVYATGAKLTEKYMRNRPGFTEYHSRTAFFVPIPPKSRLP